MRVPYQGQEVYQQVVLDLYLCMACTEGASCVYINFAVETTTALKALGVWQYGYASVDGLDIEGVVSQHGHRCPGGGGQCLGGALWTSTTAYYSMRTGAWEAEASSQVV